MKVFVRNNRLIIGHLEIISPAAYVIDWNTDVDNNPTAFRLHSTGSGSIIPDTKYTNITDCQNELGLPYTDYDDFWSSVGSFFLKASTNVTTEAVGAYGFANDANGKVDRTTSELSFDEVNRVFSITPISTFSYFYASIKNTVNVVKSVSIEDIEGKWYFYFNSQLQLVATQQFSERLILCEVLVASLYWDAENKRLVGKIFDERHGYLQDGETHLQTHLALRTQYRGGLLTNSFVIGDGSLDVHAKFTVSAGRIADEDLDHNIPASNNTIEVLYLNGNPTTVRSIVNTGFAVANTGTGRLAYNKLSDYSLAEVSDGYFVAYHIFAMPGDTEDTGQLFSLMGQNQYATLELAIEGAKTEIASIRASYLLSNEMKDVSSEIFQTSSSYANSVKAKIVPISAGVNFLDWRRSAAIPSNTPVGLHDDLNPSLASPGVQFGHVNDSTQTIAGNKTFTGDTGVKTVKFDATYNITTLSEGQVAYNKVAKTLSIGTAIPGSTIEIGTELPIIVINNTASTILNGQVVYITGSASLGGNYYPTIDLAIADTEDHAYKAIAIATIDIPSGSIGRCTVHGEIHDINTSAYTPADIIYLSPFVAGAMTNVKPSYPQGIVILGKPIVISATVGSIYVNIDKVADVQATIEAAGLVPKTTTINGHTLESDVTITKGDIELGDVDNTSDANKPISNATQTALNGKISTYTSKTAKHFLAAPNNADGLPDFRAIVASDIPTLNQNTSGTAANLSGTPALPDGTTAVKQATGDNTDKLATDSFVQMERALDVHLAGTQTITGNKTFSGHVTYTGPQFMTGIITPAALTANANDYNPPGFSTCNIVKQDATANRQVTGFEAQPHGFTFTFLNSSGSSLTIPNLSASSTVNNRVVTPNAANLVIRQGSSAQLWYDGVSLVWRIYSAAL